MITQPSSGRLAAKRTSRWTGMGWSLVAVVGLLLVPCGGCGTSEYDQRMDQRSSQLKQKSRSAPRKKSSSRPRGGDPAEDSEL